MDLLGKVVVITGASRGIGATIARRLFSRADVFLAANDTAENLNGVAIKARKLSYIPAGRYGRPEEIAEVVEFLATTDVSFIQGHNLVGDGGYLIH